MSIKERFVEKNPEVEIMSPCSNCKNKFKLEMGCKAFSDQIPDIILLGKNKHTEPLLNQGNNIIFERINDE